jgi:hypothetical protein
VIYVMVICKCKTICGAGRDMWVYGSEGYATIYEATRDLGFFFVASF